MPVFGPGGEVVAAIELTVRDLGAASFTPLWVPETLHMPCDVLIFVEESADAVASLDLADVGRCTVGERP